MVFMMLHIKVYFRKFNMFCYLLIRKLVILTLCLFVNFSYADQQQVVTVNDWVFSGVSLHKLFSTEGDSRDQLTKQYSNTHIVMESTKLTIGDVCTIDQYIHNGDTPVRTFSSQPTVNLYRKLILEAGIVFSDDDIVYSISASDPNKECTRPFDTFYEVNGLIFAVTNEGYLLFFKPVKVK